MSNMIAALQASETFVNSYSTNHPDSPLALAYDVAGPVLVTDGLRADVAHAISRKMWRQAYGLGLISATVGMQPDRHGVYSGLWLNDCLSPADYLIRWVETGCQWAKGEKQDATDRRSEIVREDPDLIEPPVSVDDVDEWARQLVASADTPAWWITWGSNLVYLPKWEFLVRLGAHEWLGAPEPPTPATDWASKMLKQWARRSHRCTKSPA